MTMPRLAAMLDRRALIAGAGAALALAAPARAQLFFDPTLRVLPALRVRDGRRFVPLLEAIDGVPAVSAGSHDLPLPENDIHLHYFPDTLAPMFAFDLDRNNHLSKREAMLAWVTLAVGWRLERDFGPGDVQAVAEGGGVRPLAEIWLPRTDRRQVYETLKTTHAGLAAFNEMRTFLRMEISRGHGPVWLDGHRQGGMPSGGGVRGY